MEPEFLILQYRTAAGKTHTICIKSPAPFRSIDPEQQQSVVLQFMARFGVRPCDLASAPEVLVFRSEAKRDAAYREFLTRVTD